MAMIFFGQHFFAEERQAKPFYNVTGTAQTSPYKKRLKIGEWNPKCCAVRHQSSTTFCTPVGFIAAILFPCFQCGRCEATWEYNPLLITKKE